jgi:hypothetical protein
MSLHGWGLAASLFVTFIFGVIAERWRKSREEEREYQERLRFANRPEPIREVCHYCGIGKKWVLVDNGCSKSPLNAHTWVVVSSHDRRIHATEDRGSATP